MKAVYSWVVYSAINDGYLGRESHEIEVAGVAEAFDRVIETDPDRDYTLESIDGRPRSAYFPYAPAAPLPVDPDDISF